MPGRKSNHKNKKNKTTKARSAAGRPIWKGTINFGLVNIPVALYSAEADNSIDFDLLDKRDFSRVRYRRVNEKTGREVPWDAIVKGYEYKKGEYVALTDDDFIKANVEATQSIDILDFVDAADISPVYFDKPYYLVPLKNGQRAYALLREVLKRTGKVGIARVVIRTREHLASLLADGALLILNLLRFPHELRDPFYARRARGRVQGVESRTQDGRTISRDHDRQVGSQKISGRILPGSAPAHRQENQVG